MKDEVRGCVYEKSGHYYARVYYYENGQRKQKNFATGILVDHSTARKTKQCETAAQRVLAELLSEFVPPAMCTSQNRLFAEVVEEWMKRQYGAKAPSTVSGYQYCVNDIVLYFSEIKPIRTVDLTATVVEDYLAWERLRRQKDYEGPYKRVVKYKDLSGVENTVSHRATVLRAILQWLKRDGVISINVASKRDCHVNLPQPQQHVFEVLTPEEADKFVEQLKDEPVWFRVAVLLALLIGLRRSEVIGLREIDFDLQERKLVIRCVVTEQTGQEKKKMLTAKMKTKNNKVKRFDLTDELVECLESMQQENRKNEESFGISYDQTWSGYLFRDTDGKLISRDVLTKYFAKFVAKVGVKNYGIMICGILAQAFCMRMV